MYKYHRIPMITRKKVNFKNVVHSATNIGASIVLDKAVEKSNITVLELNKNESTITKTTKVKDESKNAISTYLSSLFSKMSGGN